MPSIALPPACPCLVPPLPQGLDCFITLSKPMTLFLFYNLIYGISFILVALFWCWTYAYVRHKARRHQEVGPISTRLFRRMQLFLLIFVLMFILGEPSPLSSLD